MTLIALLLIALLAIIFIFGRMIVERLPEPHGEAKLRYEDCDYSAAFRITTLIEDEFKAEFVDTWDIGRSFSISGATVPYGDEDAKRPKISRVGLKIIPTQHWFEGTRIGGIRFYDSGGVEGSVRLPYQLAHQLLEEVRRRPDQVVVIGCKRLRATMGSASMRSTASR